MHYRFLNRRELTASIGIAVLAACSGGSTFSLPNAAPFPNSGIFSTARVTACSDLGAAPLTTTVNIAVVLKYHNQDQLDRFVAEQGNPDSPYYHHFLTPRQFAKLFGPTSVQYARVVDLLRNGGFTIDHTFANRTVIDAHAPAPVAEQFFSTEIHSLRCGDGRIRYANIRPEVIPASLQSAVLVVVGLDSTQTLHPLYVLQPGGTPRRVSNAKVNGKRLFGPDGGYGPEVFLTSYGFPGRMTGTGRASAVVEDADFTDSDLTGYLYYFKVKRTGPKTKRVLVDGGPPSGDNGPDSIEATLDVETIVSLEPGTALYVYEAPESAVLTSFIDMYDQVVTDNKADTVSTSYSECETAFLPDFAKAADAIFEQGSSLGVTFHAATGDRGTETYGCYSLSVGTPADTPHNVAIGGTIEDIDPSTGQETREVGWNDGSGATGAGVSTLFKLPSYQQGVANTIKSGRNIADLAFDASAYTGESFYYEGSFEGPIGGTSLSSPIFGAGLTAINELRNSRAGYFNPLLYKTWGANGYSRGRETYFRDIVRGVDAPYKAKKGYDQMSGIGAMLFGNFGRILP
jgi:subtilase family serine protease